MSTCLTFATDAPGGIQLFYGNPKEEVCIPYTEDVQQIVGMETRRKQNGSYFYKSSLLLGCIVLT